MTRKGHYRHYTHRGPLQRKAVTRDKRPLNTTEIIKRRPSEVMASIRAYMVREADNSTQREFARLMWERVKRKVEENEGMIVQGDAWVPAVV